MASCSGMRAAQHSSCSTSRATTPCAIGWQQPTPCTHRRASHLARADASDGNWDAAVPRRRRGAPKPTADSSDSSSATSSPSTSAPGGATQVKLPKTGYFSLADPKAEVYSRKLEGFDPNKKGGRFQPEFIWNTNWQEALEVQESLQRRRDNAAQDQQQPVTLAPPSDEPSQGPSAVTNVQTGAVGLGRLAELDRMDVDLSEVLRRPAKPRWQTVVNTSANGTSAKGSGQGAVKTVPLPRNDVKRLERSNRASRQMVTTVVSTTAEDEAAKAQLAAEELARYEQEKTGQRLWTLALSAVGAGVTYSMYGREVCISYTVGALAGYVYLRLLGRSVDGYAPQSAVAGVGAAVGNQRLLLPLILALGYNRWNTLYAEDFGIQLNLLAMLVGFLTYKIALVTRQGKQVLDEMSASKDQR